MSWPYKSHEQLLAAGFLLRGRIKCPVCVREIAIYQALDKMPVFLDPETCAIHLAFDHAPEPEPAPVDRKSAAAGDKD
jgi:hypothetical protein